MSTHKRIINSYLAFFCLFLLSCNSRVEKCNSTEISRDKGEKCNSTEISRDMVKINLTDLSIYFDSVSDPNLEIAKVDLINYLKKLWGLDEVEIVEGKPEEGRPFIIWFSTNEDARALSGEKITDGFLIKSTKLNNSMIILIYAPDNLNLSYGLYAFLEQLGLRFFHPEDEFIPELGGIFIPSDVNIVRTSPFKTRGIHLHLLHPIEYFRSFNESGEDNLKEAKRFIDYLVKTGQNYIQWSILQTLDFNTWIAHAKAILDYAHLRGIKVGAEIQLWGGSSLQNSYVLVKSIENWQSQISSQIDFIMQIPWDHIEIGFGEFFSAEPTLVINSLNFIADYMADNYPETTISVVNHVGNYPELWLTYNNETVFYYHLPKFADARIINNVHTVFFFDLFRDWGMYNHPNFHLQKDFILELLPTRAVRYKPESAYWVSADIDVPAFLPEYIYSRWIDINGIFNEIKNKNLPMLEGHVLFSSGHEWGYWLTDYLTAKMLWEPERDFGYFIEHYSKIYANCYESFRDSLDTFINLQSTYLFDQKLIPYISGEDFYDDIGYTINIITHPRRVQFEELLDMSEEERDSFETNVIQKLQEMAEKIGPIESSLEEKCNDSDELLKQWCLEIYDGVKIIRLRLLHSFNLYKAVLKTLKGEENSCLKEAIKIKYDARKVIEEREKYYRFDLERYIAPYKNPTIYPFGYLKQAHTLCFWKRQESQADYVINNRKKPQLSDIPTCIE